MFSVEVLKNVFPLLEGEDLAACMGVCRQWRDIASDDFYWKCQCAKKWPSVCKRHIPHTGTYYKMFQIFSKRRLNRTLPPPRLSFDMLEFFIDIWSEDKPVFSGLIPGLALESGIKTLPSGISNVLRTHLERPDYKMVVPAEPRFTIPLNQTVSVSVLVGRNDSNKVARIINRSVFDYIDRSSYRALALLTPKTVKGTKVIFSNITWAFYGENKDIILRWAVHRSWAMWFEHGQMGFGDVDMVRWASTDYLHGPSAENLPEGSTTEKGNYLQGRKRKIFK